MNIVAHYALADLDHKYAPMAHHRAGLAWTRSGYGSRIPTTHMVKLPGSRHWRRVYACVYSNVGTAYVTTPAGWAVIRD